MLTVQCIKHDTVSIKFLVKVKKPCHIKSLKHILSRKCNIEIYDPMF